MMALSSLNISTLSELTTLDLSHAANSYGAGYVNRIVPLVLPPSCSLLHLNLSYSFYAVTGMLGCTAMQHLSISAMPYNPLDFSVITLFPNLVMFDAFGAAQLSSADTLTVLQGLTDSNPLLEYLDISATGLGFFSFGPGDNWPRVKSKSLRYLAFGGLSQVVTASTGPADSGWLMDLPQLQSLNISNLPNVAIDTEAFLLSRAPLQSISIANTQIVGGSGYSLAPLEIFHQLQTLVVDGSNIVSTLPSNVSAVWPQLSYFSARSCLLTGPVPSFQGLPLLNTLLLNQNGLVGDLSPDFVADSQALVQLDLSQKYDHALAITPPCSSELTHLHGSFSCLLSLLVCFVV